MRKLIEKTGQAFDRFWFESGTLRTCVLLRICYALLLLVYATAWLVDGTRWFSDEGVMSAGTARELLEGPQWSLFFWVPATPELVHLCLCILMFNATCLLFGFFSRFQAICIFFWLVTFQHRNPIICDGEDTVFRVFAFFLIFLPLDAALSTSRVLIRRSPLAHVRWFRPWTAIPSGLGISDRAWALRLIQIQMALIYFSAAWCKALGDTWRDGTAIYYVFQMGDLFGRGWLPEAIMRSESLIRYSTWAVVIVEAALPVLLFIRPTRKAAVVLGILLHLTMEYSMHLFLFQWIMIVGLLSFVDPRWPRFRSAAIIGRQPQAAS